MTHDSTKEMDKIEFEQGKLPFGVDAETHRQHLDQLTQELETRKRCVQYLSLQCPFASLSLVSRLFTLIHFFRMIAQLKQLKERTEQIDAATQKKQTFLDGLRNEVSSIEDATKALQLYMGEPVTAQLRRQQDASALPTPLYALFCELEAYVTASDRSETMALAVVDAAPLTSAAKTSSDSHLKRSFPSALLTGASASDQDKATVAEASTKRLRGPSRSPSVATIQPVADAARVPPSRSPSVLRSPAAASPALETGEVVVTSTAEKLLALRPYDENQTSETRPLRSPTAQSNDHDMDVDEGASDDLGAHTGDRHDLWTPSPKALVLTLTLGIEGERIDGTAAAATFALRFQYLPVAKIVTVELVKPAKTASGASPVPVPSVLMNLFPGDDGLLIPRLATNYAFMDARGAETAFPHDAACRPYYWAQWICGLRAAKRPTDVAGDADATDALSPHRPEPSVRSVMTQLIKRLVTSVHLTKQLDVLATAAPSAPSVVFVHSAVRAQFLSSSSSSGSGSRTTHIESWRPIPAPTRDIFALFHDHASRSQRPDATLGCRYFRVTFKHERAKLAAIVEVAPEYPIRAPRFLFQPKTVGVSGKSESGHVATYENQLKVPTVSCLSVCAYESPYMSLDRLMTLWR